MKNILKRIEKDRRNIICGAPEGVDATVLAALAAEAGTRDVLMVARDAERAQRLADALSFFAPEAHVVEFPAWDCLPYDRVSPNAAVAGARLSALATLAARAPGENPVVVLTTAGALLGGLIEDPAAWGFDFAFTAVFIGLVAGFWRGRTTLVVACASAAGAILAHKFLPGAWYVVIGAGCGVTVAALLPQRAPGP